MHSGSSCAQMNSQALPGQAQQAGQIRPSQALVRPLPAGRMLLSALLLHRACASCHARCFATESQLERLESIRFPKTPIAGQPYITATLTA